MSKLNDIFLGKLYEKSGYASKDYVKSLIEENSDSKMIKFVIEMSNPNYVWGKGYVNGMTADKYKESIKNMVDKITFLDMKQNKDVVFNTPDWRKDGFINSVSYVHFHPMTWTVKIPVNKLEEFFEATGVKEQDIAYIIVTNVLDLIELSAKEDVVAYFNRITKEWIETEITELKNKSEQTTRQKWKYVSILDLVHHFEHKATDFAESKRRMTKEEIESYSKIIDEVAQRSFELYKDNFLNLPFIESKEENGLYQYKLKPLSKRKMMSEKNKQIAEKFDFAC